MEKAILDICNNLYKNIQETKKQIYATVIGCGRRGCSKCPYCKICDTLFEFEVKLYSSMTEENYESED